MAEFDGMEYDVAESGMVESGVMESYSEFDEGVDRGK